MPKTAAGSAATSDDIKRESRRGAGDREGYLQTEQDDKPPRRKSGGRAATKGQAERQERGESNKSDRREQRRNGAREKNKAENTEDRKPQKKKNSQEKRTSAAGPPGVQRMWLSPHSQNAAAFLSPLTPRRGKVREGAEEARRGGRSRGRTERGDVRKHAKPREENNEGSEDNASSGAFAGHRLECGSSGASRRTSRVCREVVLRPHRMRPPRSSHLSPKVLGVQEGQAQDDSVMEHKRHGSLYSRLIFPDFVPCLLTARHHSDDGDQYEAFQVLLVLLVLLVHKAS
ncbi:unnamed protein product [Lota lota]